MAMNWEGNYERKGWMQEGTPIRILRWGNQGQSLDKTRQKRGIQPKTVYLTKLLAVNQ